LLQGDQAVRVGSRKALALLAVTALDAGVTRERLASLLWPEVEPAGARRNLRRELFRLRELGVPLVEAADGAISLHPALAVDALRLLRDQALSDIGLPAFEGLDGVGSPELDVWLQRWRGQLANRRLELLAREAGASEQRGDLAAALALHAQRLAAEPCDESAALQVMRLRAGLGDPVGALHDYQRYADALRDELDVAPSEAARLLALDLRGRLGPAVETTAPVASAAVAATATGMPAIAPYVARGGSQQEIEAAWARGQRVYLHGPAGIGKTRLASEVASARGPWLRVACEPQDAELPYASVVRLLRALRDSAPDVELPEWVRRELSQLMPELGEPPQALPTADARQRLLAATAEAWRLLMQGNFSALVLDDWQWGDSASVELWSRLDDPAPATDETVAWVIVYRSAQLPTAALERQRADIDSRRAVAVALEGMDPGEVLALTHALSGSPGGRLFSQRLHEATEGNPFFLLETLRHLFAQGLLVATAGGWSTPFDEHTESYAELPVPPSVRAAVLARVRALGVPVQRLLEVAALMGGDMEPHLLAIVSKVDEESVVAALEHAQAAHLIRDSNNGWRFSHDLVRQSLVQGLSAGRRRLLHERLAGEMESGRALPALVAAQWEAALRPAMAVRWRVMAAEAALRVHALADSAAHYRQALADGAVGRTAAGVHVAMAHLHMRSTDRAAADAAFAAAAEAAAADHDAAVGRLAVLGVQLDRAEHLCGTDRIAESLALVDSLASDLAGAGPAQRAQALAVRGAALSLHGRQGEAQALLSEAMALLEGEPSARPQFGALLLSYAMSAYRRGELSAAAIAARRAVTVHESIEASAGLARALTVCGLVHNHLGRVAEAAADLQRARALAARSGNVAAQRGAILNLVKLLTDGGDIDAAAALLDEGEALAPGFEHRHAELAFREARYFVHFLRGEVDAARSAGDRLIAFAAVEGQPTGRVGALHLVVDLFLLIGDLDRARRLVDDAEALLAPLAADHEGNVYAAQQSWKRAWLALAEHRPVDALAALPPAAGLERLEDRFACAWIGCAAARALGDTALARRHLDAVAIDMQVAVDQQAPWLEQRLRLAAASGSIDEPA
ncbi:MAG: AAA family ATPase, partial [Caldimonas sp.]